MKILLTGIGQANFLNQLYSKVIPLGKIDVHIIDMTFKSEAERLQSEKIFKILPTYKLEKNILSYLLPFKSKFFWKLFFFFSISGKFKTFKTFKLFINAQIYQYNLAKMIDSLGYDVIHHHYLTVHFGNFLLYLKKTKFIVSFWGSDLFRESSYIDLFFKKQILDNAEKITVATSDMQYNVMTKYGLSLRSKIKKLKFINNNQYFDTINKLTPSDIETNRKLLFPQVEQELILSFGHSGFKEENYEDLLNCIEKIDKNTTSKFHFLFVLTYGLDKDNLVSMINSKMSKLEIGYTILSKFLSHSELANYRSCVDAFIFAPQTDAFSGYLTECFYQKVPVFVGSWLPYKEFIRMGIKYHDFDNFNDLKEMLINIDDFVKSDYRGNREIVKQYFIESNDSVEWSKLYINA
ncbi:glycosyltransferase [Epilithonimonas zeae]|uniref:Glycosyltransferase involved in cell wall bisynthesis n=1 Tax=Epilithonimonas zeae TaxID=1416779 RepID=A0A1N6J506_9FLAO|nr:glycosyltransferase [Epilithonimonas zeae]SIO39377.1 Glycosyltransferase involved in cell wall bisynthesis [Epilithonimonas zeae]